MKLNSILLVVVLGFVMPSLVRAQCQIVKPPTICTDVFSTFSMNCSATSYSWYVNNVLSGVKADLNYIFTAPGTYSIKLTYSGGGVDFQAQTMSMMTEEESASVAPGGGSTNIETTVVVIANLAAFTLTADPPSLCDAGNVVLSSPEISNQSGVSFSWSSNPSGFTGNAGQLAANALTQNTSFTLSASNGSCSRVVSYQVEVEKTTASFVDSDAGGDGGDETMMMATLMPINPPPPSSGSPAAGPAYHMEVLLTENGTDHYWQTTPQGTNLVNYADQQFNATEPGDYYLRKFNTLGGCWTIASNPIHVELSYTPPAMSVKQIKKLGYNEVDFLNNDLANILTYADYYWVDASGNQFDPPRVCEDGSAIIAEGTYYIKGWDKGTGTGGGVRTITASAFRSDNELNYIHTKAFDGTKKDGQEVVVSESKSYFDYAGRNIQNQSKNLTNDQVLASQSLRDVYGREVASTLPAPTNLSIFSYKENFVTGMPLSEGGSKEVYSYKHFDQEKLLNPVPVDNEIPGTLGWYYSNNNTLEEFVPTTSFPYSRTEFYEDGTGEVKRSASPGDQLRLGMGHEVVSGTFPVYNELDDYLTKRTIAIPGITQDGSLRNEGVQYVSRDQNGKYLISISDKSGKIVMSALAGTIPANVLAISNVVTSNVTVGSVNNRKMTYFYILEDQPVSLVGSGDFVAQNIVTGEQKSVGQTFASGAQNNWPAGFYRIILNAGEIELRYTNYFQDISYQFYDDMGRLKSSISPNGFKAWKAGTPYNLIDKTTYAHNFRGWLLSMNEPDAGTTTYKYRRDGKIRFSQNAQQVVDNRFSYTNYDNLGRPIESGEYKGTTYSYSSLSTQLEFDSQITFAAADVKDWVKTFYDLADTDIYTQTNLPSSFKQEFIRGAVSYTENINIKTWYSYDELGRVTWMAQKPKVLTRVFVSTYEYDFLGSVLKTSTRSYEAGGLREQFHHHYEYDKDKRLSRAFTSTDGTTKKLRASYEYYLHGPLKRIELGGAIAGDDVVGEIQGVDFVYNIHGWLTQINHPNQDDDPGGDNNDAFGMVLDYYESAIQNLFQTSMNTTPVKPNAEAYHGLPVQFRIGENALAFHARPVFKISDSDWKEMIMKTVKDGKASAPQEQTSIR